MWVRACVRVCVCVCVFVCVYVCVHLNASLVSRMKTVRDKSAIFFAII